MGNAIGDILGTITMGILGNNMQQDAQKKAMEEQRKAEMEARRIQAQQKPMEETATMLTDTGKANTLDSLGLVVNPNKTKVSTAGLGSSTATAGLGFGG